MADAARFIILFGLLFLFFIQQLTMLIEAVYRYNLLDTSFGPGTLGLLCFFSPLYLFFKKSGLNHRIYQFLWIFLFLQGLVPWLPNPLRIAGAGFAVALFLISIIPLLSGALGGNARQLASGMVLSVLVSISLRAFGSTVDISLNGNGVFLAWLLIVPAALLLFRLDTGKIHRPQPAGFYRDTAGSGRYFYMAGFFSVVAFIYIMLASPGVVARWTASGYLVIHIVLSVSLAGTILLLNTPEWMRRLKKWPLIVWNGLFFLALLLCISLPVSGSPATAQTAPLIVRSSSMWEVFLTYCMVALSPVLFLDMAVFTSRLSGRSPLSLAGPALVSSLLMLMVLLILILTNVWGYTGITGRVFRHRFYLPFLMLSLGVIFPLWFTKSPLSLPAGHAAERRYLMMAAIGFCCLIIAAVRFTASNPPDAVSGAKSFVAMTFNLQQGTDFSGNESFAGQLAVIRKIHPDILCLQESDGARISGGNSDIVRYLADHLDYYSYFGPQTVTGTFGTAILSRFPLSDCRSIFTYSDTDEIGTAVCRVTINNEPVLVINSHPDGSDRAKQAHLDMLIKLAGENKRVLALGDFNFRPDSPFYDQISKVLRDSWLPSDFPDVAKRIDYIFLSKYFRAIKRYYIPSPASASDHPAYGALIEMIEDSSE